MDLIPYGVLYFSLRSEQKINCIILHDTGGKTAKGTLTWFNTPDLPPEKQVSSHYLIDRDGKIYQCVEDENKAWHAGSSSLWGEDNVNDWSLGIEIVDDNDADAYPDKQLEALFELCESLIIKYEIPLNRIVGHQHVCVPKGRKADPGRDFQWYPFLVTLGARISTLEINET